MAIPEYKTKPSTNSSIISKIKVYFDISLRLAPKCYHKFEVLNLSASQNAPSEENNENQGIAKT